MKLTLFALSLCFFGSVLADCEQPDYDSCLTATCIWVGEIDGDGECKKDEDVTADDCLMIKKEEMCNTMCKYVIGFGCVVDCKSFVGNGNECNETKYCTMIKNESDNTCTSVFGIDSDYCDQLPSDQCVEAIGDDNKRICVRTDSTECVAANTDKCYQVLTEDCEQATNCEEITSGEQAYCYENGHTFKKCDDYLYNDHCNDNGACEYNQTTPSCEYKPCIERENQNILDFTWCETSGCKLYDYDYCYPENSGFNSCEDYLFEEQCNEKEDCVYINECNELSLVSGNDCYSLPETKCVLPNCQYFDTVKSIVIDECYPIDDNIDACSNYKHKELCREHTTTLNCVWTTDNTCMDSETPKTDEVCGKVIVDHCEFTDSCIIYDSQCVYNQQCYLIDDSDRCIVSPQNCIYNSDKSKCAENDDTIDCSELNDEDCEIAEYCEALYDKCYPTSFSPDDCGDLLSEEFCHNHSFQFTCVWTNSGCQNVNNVDCYDISKDNCGRVSEECYDDGDKCAEIPSCDSFSNDDEEGCISSPRNCVYILDLCHELAQVSGELCKELNESQCEKAPDCGMGWGCMDKSTIPSDCTSIDDDRKCRAFEADDCIWFESSLLDYKCQTVPDELIDDSYCVFLQTIAECNHFAEQCIYNEDRCISVDGNSKGNGIRGTLIAVIIIAAVFVVVVALVVIIAAVSIKKTPKPTDFEIVQNEMTTSTPAPVTEKKELTNYKLSISTDSGSGSYSGSGSESESDSSFSTTGTSSG